jgi:hypothetical protein
MKPQHALDQVFEQAMIAVASALAFVQDIGVEGDELVEVRLQDGVVVDDSEDTVHQLLLRKSGETSGAKRPGGKAEEESLRWTAERIHRADASRGLALDLPGLALAS